MGEREEPPPTGPRRGWRLLGLIVLGLGLLSIGVGFWWYHDDSDLAAIRAKARDQGRPLAWADLGLKADGGERVQQWQRVAVLVQGLPAFQNKAGPDGKFFKVWDPVPEALREHHAALDATTVDELVAVLERLGDQPLVLHDQISYGRLMHEVGTARSLIRFMQERLLLAEPQETGAWARRMLATCRRFSVDSLMLHLVRTSFVDATMNGIAFRLGDLKQNDPIVADEILATLRPHHDNLLRALDGEFVMMLDTVGQPGLFRDHSFSGDDGWYMHLVVRAGRHGALDTYLEAMAALRRQKPDTMLAWATATDARIHAARGTIPYPSLMLSGLFMPAWSAVVRSGELTVLRGRVIAAELRDAPWPVDVFDPTGAPVRAIRRDGRVIAAYSVHTDGIDQGGDERADRVIPLYAKP